MVETEESFTYTEFRDAFSKKWNLWRKRKVDTPVIIGIYSNGTRFFWEDELGDRHYGLISDLSSFSIARLGQSNVTLGVGVASASVTATISPTLNDTVLGNWRLFATLRTTNTALVSSVIATLASTSQASFRVSRISTITGTASTQITVGAGDLTDVDITFLNPHGSDIGLGPHGHTTTGHPVTDPTHSHTVTGGLVSVLYTVDWLIVHK